MKNILIVLMLLILVLLTSCHSKKVAVEYKYEVVDKYTTTESSYNWFLESYKTYTAYWLILENDDVLEVKKEIYAKYDIGDYYTIIIYEDVKEE